MLWITIRSEDYNQLRSITHLMTASRIGSSAAVTMSKVIE